MKLGLLSLSLFSFLLSTPALAARLGFVDSSDDVEIREQPNATSKVLDKIKKGTAVAASNLPVDGFYKIRTLSGSVGWVNGNTLKLNPVPTPEELLAAGAPSSAEDENKSTETAKTREEKIQSTKKSFRLRALGGMNFSTLGGIVNNFGNLGLTYYYGGEMVVMVSNTIGMVLRAENLFNTTVLTDTTTGNIYRVNVGSIPIMLGPEYAVFGSSFSFHLGALAGAAIPSSVSSTVMSGTNSGGVAQMSSSHVTALLKMNFNWQFYSAFSLFLEGGYRYSVSPVFITPTATAGTAGSIFQSTFTLTTSGPFMGVGLALGF